MTTSGAGPAVTVGDQNVLKDTKTTEIMEMEREFSTPLEAQPLEADAPLGTPATTECTHRFPHLHARLQRYNQTWDHRVLAPFDRFLSKVPGLRALPPSVMHITILLILVNIVAWVIALLLLRSHPTLLGPATLAYTFGLRHAFDADHITAIDNATRKLVSLGHKSPTTVGTFFSLGHSSVVVVTCIIVSATSAALAEKWGDWQNVGGIIGVSVSCSFLFLMAAGNAVVLVALIRDLRRLRAGRSDKKARIFGGGLLTRVFGRLFRLIDRPWKMYPLGVLFGLGFDTSTEIALLGIASIQAAKGTSLWLLLVFPMLFTAGMCLIDTVDGAMMFAAYTSPHVAANPIARTWYSLVLTGMSVVIAVVIGVIQLLSLILNVAEPEGPFWDGVERAGEYYDIIGGAIVGGFVLVVVGSIVVWKIWGERIEGEAGRARRTIQGEGADGEVVEMGELENQPRDEHERKTKTKRQKEITREVIEAQV
ncbi:hypothetical protein YB2330_001514 [Saitoella coloradoensis]